MSGVILAHPSPRLLLSLSVSLLLLLTAHCGGGDDGTTTPLECSPPCPAKWHCTETGCVSDEPGGDLAVPAGIDLAVDCPVACGGLTPHCAPNHQCVPCLADAHCPIGQVCKPLGGTYYCAPGCADDARCGAPGSGILCCNGACIDSSKDPQNCGGCGTACMPAHAGPSCMGGVCAAGTCNKGWADCNMNEQDGCETYLRADPANCAGCGNACALSNAINGCSGACFIAACNYGFEDCNEDPKDGCEVGLLADTRNCGACAKVCGSVPRGQVACVVGNCVLASCSQGFADCNKLFNDGCEVNLLTDRVNCGTCGLSCAQGQVCVNADCTCPPCSFPNARAICAAKQCVIDQCINGWGDCDGNPVNGCERNIGTDVQNCGACGKQCGQGLVCNNGSCTCPQCNMPNAKTACINNVCVLDSCLPGYGNCDKNDANGCEVDLVSNANNCGACGNQCGGLKPYCLGGVCTDVAKSCGAIKIGAPNSGDGTYTIDPDGQGGIAPLQVYCDMTTDGGGWTLVYASAGGDGEVGMSSDVAAGGNPLQYGYYNQTRAFKMVISSLSRESIFKRKLDSAWIKASAPLYDNLLSSPNSHMHVLMNLTASNGASAQGYLGYANFNTAGGGDYGLSLFPDGGTCAGNTINGFDHHAATYYHLNCDCLRHYLYSYSTGVQDGDQSYKINTTLGTWTATAACSTTEGGGLVFYAGMR